MVAKVFSHLFINNSKFNFDMPNTKSAKKELRKSKTRQVYNKKIKDNVKTLVKKSRKAIEAGDVKAKELVEQTFKAIDKAAQKGVIKKNTRDRKKSRLHQKLNQSLKKSK
jgi:small subunit ribosomal protein S20